MAQQILEQAVFDAARRAELAAGFLSDEVPTPEEAWQGARDIVAEGVSDDARSRELARSATWAQGALVAEVADEGLDPKRTYQLYYAFRSGLKQIKPHQVLALNRGERGGVLRVAVEAEGERLVERLAALYPARRRSPLAADLRAAVADAYRRLIAPAIEREVRRALTEEADAHAIRVFATNLRNLLLAPPIRGRVVLGVDPGFRTGCKLAVVDETGRVLDTGTIYPHPPQQERARALQTLHTLVLKHGVTLVAVGNGTASRETEELIASLIQGGADVEYLIVSEAGASVYSASPLARAELPDLDVSLRGAVSIARRAQDPLAELVKIDPKSIGVGMYQHDVDQAALAAALEEVTASVVNAVGVDANTASPALLQHVAGLGPALAERVVAYRDAHGPFRSREQLQRVKGLGPKTYQQAAGFLRVPAGPNPLDNTAVHPESYAAVGKLLARLRVSLEDPHLPEALRRVQAERDMGRLAAEIGVGEPTLRDIVAELQRPGRDPREDVSPPLLRRDVLKIEDLRPGMKLYGTVRNVVDFGAFVDIGVKQDGLVHISQMAAYRVESPYEVAGVGDVVEVTVLDVDAGRGRIALSMRDERP